MRSEDVDLDGRMVAVRRSLTRIPGGYAFNQPKTARERRIIPLPAAAAETLALTRSTRSLSSAREASRWEPLDLDGRLLLFDAQLMRA